MNTLQAIALGALQGATEFLPVSSSGHLVVARELFGIAEIPVVFDVILHVATLVAVVIVLRAQVTRFLVAIGRALRRDVREEDRVYLRLVPIIIVTTAVTGAIGIALDSFFDIRSPVITSVMFLVTALLLILSRRASGSRSFDHIGWSDAVVLGVAQGFGVFPGISRSGITISTALYRKIDRRTAGEYSFLLSIPAILGALLLTIGDLGELGVGTSTVAIIAGAASACVVGFLSLTLLLKIVRSGRLYLFAVYLIPLGIGGLWFFTVR